MTNISMDSIKALRQKTGIGLSKCKEALEACNGDLDQAIVYLRKMGLASAEKKEGRETKEGVIKIAFSDSSIALIEINVETDFVANNEKCQLFADDLANELLTHKTNDIKEFLSAPFSKDSSLTIENYRSLVVQTLGENIQIKKILVISKEPQESYGFYSHNGGKVVSLVILKGNSSSETLAKDIAMHVTALNPEYLNPEAIPKEVIVKEQEIARTQIQNKPENVIEKIVSGKLAAFFSEHCLTRQGFVKDPTITIENLLKNNNVLVKSFYRWKVGS